MGKYTLLVDVTKCIGCYSCRVSCQTENNLPIDRSYVTFCEVEKGTFPEVEWVMHRFSCMHCTDAACEKVCPQNAISYSETGAVVIDQNQCIGCEYCMKNCPFGAVNVSLVKDEKGLGRMRANKCTLCNGRLLEGNEPVCASTCYTGAIVYGEREEILELAEERLQNVKGRYPDATIYNPSGVGGTHAIYVLAHDPSEYGLQINPTVPVSALVWKDYAQPLGKAILGFTTMAVISGAISNKLFNKDDQPEGGKKRWE
jgi:formate dehydrogenase iron-sulfur subunit